MIFQNKLFEKKGQFYVLSILFFLLLILFIYYAGTDNTYIVKSTKFNLVENIMYETCQIGYLSNGSNIDFRFNDFEISVFNYCDDFGFNCTLSIINNSVLPTNLTLLNYTYYDYHIEYVNQNYKIIKEFNC